MLISEYLETFPGKPELVTVVREQVYDHLAVCPKADDVVLIVSEFASNAVLHSLSRAGTFTVRVQLYWSYVYIEVEDDGGPWRFPEYHDRPHGLEIVSELTGRDWGVDPVGEGHRIVWARVSV
jgi:anti-sigma regulatory factor (Ser/Thr protein kinase)